MKLLPLTFLDKNQFLLRYKPYQKFPGLNNVLIMKK